VAGLVVARQFAENVVSYTIHASLLKH